jgi:hypothetical protein
MEGTDLIYEGITTEALSGRRVTGRHSSEGTDLIYEGITTQGCSPPGNIPEAEGTDLIYEGITTIGLYWHFRR